MGINQLIKRSLKVIACILLLAPDSYAIKTTRPKVITTIKQCDSLELAFSKRFEEANRCVSRGGDRAVAKFVKWFCIQEGKCDLGFKQISQFIDENPAFPDQEILVKRAEDKITDETPKDELVSWFTHHKPRTGNGIKYYYNLKLPTIQKQETLIGAAKYGWIYGNHNRDERALYLSEYGKYLTTKDHIAKVNVLLERGNTKIDDDIFALLPQEYALLIKARVLLREDHKNFAKVINKVPLNLRKDAGLLLAEAMWYKHNGKQENVIKLLSDNANNVNVRSDDWFKIRTLAAAELMDNGEYKKAYSIARNHNYKDLVNYVDGEWLAGRISYIYLSDYKSALAHFQNILKTAKYSVSKSRGAYWAAMAARKLKNEELTREYFAEAAKYHDTFYGQLAVTQNNKDHYVVLNPDPIATEQDLNWFKNDQLVRISKLLIAKKRYGMAEKFLKAVVMSTKNPARIMLVVRMGYSIDIPKLSVSSGKEAIRGGCFLPQHSYPTLKFSPNSDQIEKAFMLSIIRQESAFDHQAVSSAEAMGLMQMIHPTAKDVGKELGVKFKKQDLVNNPRLNLTFGCHHLTKSVESYNGSYVLAAAAYNAGPGNVNKWIEKYGDPRDLKTVEQVVVWIEKTPFFETRGYIQNVLANLQIYRSLLKDSKSNKIKINLDKDLLNHH